MTHSADQAIRTRYPIPARVRPESIAVKDARSIQRILVNAGLRCEVTTHVGVNGGQDRPVFLGCTAAEVVAAAQQLHSLDGVSWLKIVKAEQVIGGVDGHGETFHAFTSPLLVWAPLRTEPDDG